MFLLDKLREQLPRALEGIEFEIKAYRVGKPANVTFKANGRPPIELEVNSVTGLTELQCARLCAEL